MFRLFVFLSLMTASRGFAFGQLPQRAVPSFHHEPDNNHSDHTQSIPFLIKRSRVKTALHVSADLQSDSKYYGRGHFHLSANLSEGDVVAYQTGTWLVDGVPVGNEPPTIEYCQIETIQVVWTHNCEHGVLRGMELKKKSRNSKSLVSLEATGEAIEFGPEQLVARIPVEWNDDPSFEVCTPRVPLDEREWMLEV